MGPTQGRCTLNRCVTQVCFNRYNGAVSYVRPALCALFLFGCASNDQDAETAALADKDAAALASAASADADVTNVFAREEQDGTWTFHVSVKHPDTGFRDFADGWDLVTSNGAVIKADPTQRFTKILRRPHVKEQPFTRTVKGLELPKDVVKLTVRAHDSVGGFGGREVQINLNRRFGKNFSVKRAL